MGRAHVSERLYVGYVQWDEKRVWRGHDRTR